VIEKGPRRGGPSTARSDDPAPGGSTTD
jgi:hypothetical protein